MNAPSHPAGIILSAGASSRMGSVKALLPYAGETFVDRLILALGTRCDPVIVVVGHHAARIRDGARLGDRVRFIQNPDPDRGQLSSLQCGLDAVPADASGALFTPVDHPAIAEATVVTLADALEAGVLAVIPRYGGRRGHPVAIARALFGDFLALPPGATAKDVLLRHAGGIRYVDVDDPGILLDIDDLETYRSLLETARP